MSKRFTVLEGSEAAARIAHLTCDVIEIYQNTPSSAMGEFADAWSAGGQKNIWGVVPEVIEMQSEAGAAGTRSVLISVFEARCRLFHGGAHPITPRLCRRAYNFRSFAAVRPFPASVKRPNTETHSSTLISAALRSANSGATSKT